MSTETPDDLWDPDFDVCFQNCVPLIEGLTKSLERRAQKVGLDRDDLFQEAFLSLKQRVHPKYDHSGPFENYARVSITLDLRNRISRAQTNSWPDRCRRARAKVQEARSRLFAAQGRDPSPEEIAREATVPVDVVNDVLLLEAQASSIDDENKLPGRLEDDAPAEVQAAEDLNWNDRCRRAELTGLERRVLELRQGMVPDENGKRLPRPRKLVAKILSEEGYDGFISGPRWLEERVRDHEVAAIGKLRRRASEE